MAKLSKREVAYRKWWKKVQKESRAEDIRIQKLHENTTPITLGILHKLFYNAQGHVSGSQGESGHFIDVHLALKQLEEMVKENEQQS